VTITYARPLGRTPDLRLDFERWLAQHYPDGGMDERLEFGSTFGSPSRVYDHRLLVRVDGRDYIWTESLVELPDDDLRIIGHAFSVDRDSEGANVFAPTDEAVLLELLPAYFESHPEARESIFVEDGVS
jgi:hypothetical protein